MKTVDSLPVKSCKYNPRATFCLLMLCVNDLPARDIPLGEGQEITGMDDREGGETMIIVDLGDDASLASEQVTYLKNSFDVVDAIIVPAWAAPTVTRTETWRKG